MRKRNNSWPPNTGRNSTGAGATPVLWGLAVVALLLIWFATLSFFDPKNQPQTVDGDPTVTGSVAQLTSIAGKKENRNQSTSGAWDYSRSDRSESQVTRSGSSAGSQSADPGTVARQGDWRTVSGSPAAESADAKASEVTGEGSDESESQATDSDQPEVAGEDTARSGSDSNDSTPNDSEQDNWDSDPYEDDNLGGDFSISGQVVNEGGYPVSGIEIVAVARRLFNEELAVAFDSLDSPVEQQTIADRSGLFEFYGLPNGEYQISTVATDYYPIVASTVSRAGVDSLKLVVVVQRQIRINGFVATPQGKPLGGVEIAANSSAEPLDISDGSGNFSFRLAVRSDRSELVSFWAEGYQEEKVPIAPRQWEGGQPVELDVFMVPEKVLTAVSGILRSKSGAPVVGEQVYLQRTPLKYKAVSDQNGEFIIEDVESGGGYALWLMPAGPFQQYRQDGLNVPSGGLDGLKIVLDPTGVGTVMGQMIDPVGDPITNFTLTVRSESSRITPLPVVSDSSGFFLVENVPEGRLRFESSSFPRFVVSGIQLAAGEEIDAELVINLGAEQMTGQVTDDQGNPIAAADITLSWVLREDGVVHEALRKTTTSPDGRFLLTQLGIGEQTVIVRAPGFQVAQLVEQIGAGAFDSDIEVQLEPDSE